MDELYSFDIIGDYNVAVQPLDDGSYEAIVYKVTPQNPNMWKSFPTGEMARDWGIGTVEALDND